MARFSFGSLRVRLILLVLLAILPAMGLVVYSGLKQREEARQDALRHAELAADLAAEQQNFLAVGTRKMLLTLSHIGSEFVGGNRKQCDLLLSTLLGHFPEYLILGAADPNGDVFCSAPSSDKPVNIADEPYFRQSFQTGNFSTGEYQFDPLSNQETFIIGYPIFDALHQSAGVVYAAINLDWLNQFTTLTNMPEGSSLTVLDHDGTIIARSPDPEIWIGKTLSATPLIQEILSNGGKGTAEAPGLDGIQRLYAFMPVDSQSSPSLFVSFGIPTEIAFAKADRDLATNLIGLGIIAILALEAAWFGGNIFILNGTKAMLKAIKRLEAGDLSARTGLPNGQGEINQIAGAFDQMAQSLQIQKAETERADTARRKSEENFRSLFENIPIGLYTTAPDGTILEANPTLVEMLGYPNRESLMLTNVVDLYVNPVDRDEQYTVLDQNGIVKGYEMKLRRADGEEIWARDTFRAIKDTEGKILFNDGSLEDITSRMKTEKALRESEHTYRALFEHANDAIFLLSPEGVHLAVNQQAADMLGYTRDELIGMSLGDIVASGEIHDAEVKRDALFAGKSLPIYERNFKSKDGRIFPVEINASLVRDVFENPLYIQRIVRDISRRKQAEFALKQSEERYRSTLDSMMEGCQIIGFDWRYRYLNAEVARQGQKTIEELLGHTMMQVYPGIKDTHMFSVLQRCMQERTPAHIENEFAYPNGTTGWFELSIEPVQEGIFILSIDITARKRAEQEFQRVNRALKVLSAGNQAVIRATDEDELLNEICEIAVEIGKYRFAWIGCAEQNEAKSVLTKAHAGFEQGYLNTVKFTWDESELGRGPTGSAIRTGEPTIVKNVLDDPDYAPWCSEASKRGYQSVIGLPLTENIKPFGAITIYAEESNAFDNEEVRLLEELAADLAFGILSLRSRRKNEQAEIKIHRQLESLAALRAIDLAITSSLDIRVIFDVLLDKVTAQLNLDAACMLLLNPHTQILEYTASRGFRTQALQHTNLKLGEGLAGLAALERKIIKIDDLRDSGTDFSRSPVFSLEGFLGYYAVPLIAKGYVKGVMEVFQRDILDPDQEWMDFLEALAGQAAIAVDNAGLFNELQRSNIDLMLAYDTTIEGWSKALDLRDRETEGHSQRVTDMTLKLARKFGISDAELIHVRRGALLHDIGKMGIPDTILLKPGALTDQEWEIMRKHPAYAYELLSPIAYLRPALDIPYCHHEKWDGSGYPRGLTGEQIPLAARIFALADVWDALRSDRPYRQAWSLEKVLEYIQGQVGKHFDQKVVETFLKTMEDKVRLGEVSKNNGRQGQRV